MEVQRRLRKVARQAHTRAVHAVEDAIGARFSSAEIRRLVDILRSREDELRTIDEALLADEPDDTLEEEYQTICEYRDRAVSARSRADSYLSDLRADSVSSIASASTFHVSSVNLPKLNLPSFSGDLLDWRPFWSQYKAAVHDSPLPEVQKLTQLISCLRGPALEAVKGLQVTGDNYQTVVDLLKRRYGDPCSLIGLYATRLVTAPPVNEGDGKAFRKTIDAFCTSLREMRLLIDEVREADPSVETHDLILGPLLLMKLPGSSRIEWSRRKSDPALRFSLPSLLEFAHSEVEALDALRDDSGRRGHSSAPKPASRSVTGALTASAPVRGPRIKDLRLAERLAAVREQRLCYVCLSRGHAASKCPSSRNCSHCSGRHHDLLHGTDLTQPLASDPPTRTSPIEEAPQSLTTTSTPQASSSRTLLQTAAVHARAAGSGLLRCRLLLDSGSEMSFITRSLARRLNARTCESRAFAVEGFGGTCAGTKRHERVRVTLLNKRTGREICLDFWTVDNLCSPVPGLSKARSRLPREIAILHLAETFDSNPMPIDCIVGSDNLAQVLEPLPPIRSGRFCAWATAFDWVVTGPASGSCSTLSNFANVYCLKNSIKDPACLWDLEAVGIAPEELQPPTWPPPTWTGERYQVKLPWKDDLRPSFTVIEARKRLGSFHRLSEDKKAAYKSSIVEWENQSIIEPASPSGGSYIPHHGVAQRGKLRVVIDGSASPRAGSSINDCLLSGPPIHLDLPSIVHRFRSYRHGLSADIAKAYLMISVDPEDRPYLKVVHPEGRTLQFARLPFGLNCSAALLNHVIQHHLTVCEDREAAAVISRSMYVDDLLCGADSEEDLMRLKTTSEKLFASAGMSLHKFASSVPILSDDSDDIAEAQAVCVLGLHWRTSDDSLSVALLPRSDLTVSTKRDLLSAAAKTFDPLGFVNPWTVRYRLLVQDAWSQQIGLDEELPDVILEQVRALQREADSFKDVTFDRYLPVSSGDRLEAYADASIKAYATCIYLFSQGKRRLVFSRYRVAPLKRQKLTIPRLELMAAVLAVRSVTYLKSIRSDFSSLPCLFFTDSMIALGWIRGDPTDVFVRNRSREINRLSDSEDWDHVPTGENPADLITRGMTAEDLSRNQKWWTGPSSEFKVVAVVGCPKTCQELTPRAPLFPIDRWSTWRKASRIVAWILRFSHNCRVARRNRHLESLSAEEVGRAEKFLLRDAQRELNATDFEDRFRLSTREDGLIVGRLRTGEDSLPFLPRDSVLVPLIIRHIHSALYHQGVSSTCAEYCRAYLTPRIRQVTKSVLSKCFKCNRVNSRPFKSDESALPDFRTQAAHPFARTGIDHFGPLLVGKGVKVWILLFTCAAVRAVHMEVVTSLDEETTSLAIRRFQAVRGPVSEIYSDNGRSFVALQRAWKDHLTWRTIPVRSPWWGGWWERMIGTVKRALKITISHSHLNLTELQTVVSECAERINRRPLVSAADPTSDPLTPAHFLYGRPPPPLLSASVTEDESQSLGSRWRHRKTVLAHLWERWRSEYLISLRSWRRPPLRANRSPIPGEIVLCSSRPLPRGKWPLARVVRLIPGRDGVVRSAVVRIGSRDSRRATSLLHPLECGD